VRKPCFIGIEVSTGAFYWRRQFEKLGHAVKIMAPQYVQPFVRRQKNDSNDAEAICTAVQQRNMRFVPKRTLEQHEIQAAFPRPRLQYDLRVLSRATASRLARAQVPGQGSCARRSSRCFLSAFRV
jgi:transposase